MDGWADSVDTVRSAVGSRALRLIVSQMNALMNPHYITRLVCEEKGRKEGRQAGGQAGGLLYISRRRQTAVSTEAFVDFYQTKPCTDFNLD